MQAHQSTRIVTVTITSLERAAAGGTAHLAIQDGMTTGTARLRRKAGLSPAVHLDLGSVRLSLRAKRFDFPTKSVVIEIAEGLPSGRLKKTDVTHRVDEPFTFSFLVAA